MSLLRFLWRKPDFLIGPHDDPYMRRWWVIPRNKRFNVYLHHIRHDDDDRALHDHPWWSVSFLLKGRVSEVHGDALRQTHRTARWLWPHYRSSTFAHRLFLPEGSSGAWTLFITGPVIRDWGFHCPNGWRPWRLFVDDRDSGQVGAGCGEHDESAS